MHKCFISYHQEDRFAVARFIREFNQFRPSFIARAVGISQDIIDSTDSDYIIRRLREKYLTDSTVTVVMIGRCTWARRYVDWEIASSLRNDPRNKRSGLVAISLPYMNDATGASLPPRVRDNWNGENGYARWWKYPQSARDLEYMIELANSARDTLGHLVDNSRGLFKYNKQCG